MTERKLGGVGSYVLIENEQVKVWQNNLEPGESSDWHLHENNYLFIAIEPGNLKVEFDDGTSQTSELHQGQVVMGEKDSIHQLSNVGDKSYSSVIIELKKE